jgi:hypothetical protein
MNANERGSKRSVEWVSRSRRSNPPIRCSAHGMERTRPAVDDAGSENLSHWTEDVDSPRQDETGSNDLKTLEPENSHDSRISEPGDHVLLLPTTSGLPRAELRRELGAQHEAVELTPVASDR